MKSLLHPFCPKLLALSLLAMASSVVYAANPEFTEVPGLSQPANSSQKPTNPGTGPSPATNSPGAATINSMDSLDDKYKIAIGDRLSFRIVEDEEDPKPLIVTDSGELEVPYIGRFPAAGKSCRELAYALKKELEKEYYYQATVILAVDVMTKSRGKVYIVGPVRAPGPIEIPSDEVLTLSKAILRAGGFTDFADKKSVRVTRNTPGSGEQNFKVNVATILDKGKTEGDLKLEPGDLIVVPERAVRF